MNILDNINDLILEANRLQKFRKHMHDPKNEPELMGTTGGAMFGSTLGSGIGGPIGGVIGGIAGGVLGYKTVRKSRLKSKKDKK
jgi:outer membrane lipoprotein SlyB